MKPSTQITLSPNGGPSAVSMATLRPKSTKTSIYCFLNDSTNDRMCLLSLTAPDSNLGAVYLSSFRFHVKRVDNAVRFPVLRSRQFWWFHVLSHSQCRPFSWVGLDNTLDFSKGGRGFGEVYLSSLFKELAFMLVYTRCSSKYISEVMIKGICTTLHICN